MIKVNQVWGCVRTRGSFSSLYQTAWLEVTLVLLNRQRCLPLYLSLPACLGWLQPVLTGVNRMDVVWRTGQMTGGYRGDVTVAGSQTWGHLEAKGLAFLINDHKHHPIYLPTENLIIWTWSWKSMPLFYLVISLYIVVSISLSPTVGLLFSVLEGVSKPDEISANPSSSERENRKDSRLMW